MLINTEGGTSEAAFKHTGLFKGLNWEEKSRLHLMRTKVTLGAGVL